MVHFLNVRIIMMVKEREVYQINNIVIDLNFIYILKIMKCIQLIN
jgi:hypothetical protein